MLCCAVHDKLFDMRFLRMCLMLLPSLSMFAQGRHEHEAYTGDRTKDSLVTFADSLVPSAGQPHLKHGQLKAAPRTPGCNVAGGALAASKRGGGRSRCVAWRGICIAACTGSKTFGVWLHL